MVDIYTDLSDKGYYALSPSDPQAFVVPDLSEVVGQIERDESLSTDTKRDRIAALEQEYATKSQKMHAIHQLLKAYTLYNKDEQYIIEDGQVIIVDEFTGRKMTGRRWSDGLHQAVEAKEGVVVRGETQTLATITIQNYFRMYDKLAGMTGTALTEAEEFHKIYKLEVMVMPTNKPMARKDQSDQIYKDEAAKFEAVVKQVEELYKTRAPVLIGTISIEKSEVFRATN